MKQKGVDKKPGRSSSVTKVEMEIALENMERRTDERARDYRDQILTKMDQIVGELVQIREDRLFEKHEKKELEVRIKRLEKKHNN